ncbi:phage BR0599 family protein [Salmonella enterica]
MSWNEYEASVANGQPLLLVEFIRGGAQFWRYTNADRMVSYGGHDWEPAAIAVPGVTVGTGDSLDVIIPAVSPVAGLFRGIPPSSPLRIKIHRVQAEDAAAEVKTVWIGSVSEAKHEEIDRVKLITVNVSTTFARNGLRLTWGRACPYSLYDRNCAVNPAQYAFKTSIKSLDGGNITVASVSGLAAGALSGGYMTWVTDGITERRGLKGQNGAVIGVFGGTQGLAAGLAVTLYPGCDRTIQVCNDKFNNVLNYGGQPHMPGKSPYEIIKLF